MIRGGRSVKEREDFFKHLLLLLLDFKEFCVSDEYQKFLNKFAEIIFNHVAVGVGADKTCGALAFICLTGVGYMRMIAPEEIDIDKQFKLIKKISLLYLNEKSTLIKKKTPK